MSIAALLARAKRELAGEVTASFAQGDDVTNDEGHRGRVAFVEDGWVHWVAESGRVHASRPESLRRP